MWLRLLILAIFVYAGFGLKGIEGIAIGMVLYRRKWQHHSQQFWHILTEVLVIRDPNELSALAADRKSSMLLLPYGIPIAIGTIGYFAYAGMML